VQVTQAKMIEKDASMKFVTDDGEEKYAKVWIPIPAFIHSFLVFDYFSLNLVSY
jgi:hypothetical protein